MGRAGDARWSSWPKRSCPSLRISPASQRWPRPPPLQVIDHDIEDQPDQEDRESYAEQNDRKRLNEEHDSQAHRDQAGNLESLFVAAHQKMARSVCASNRCILSWSGCSHTLSPMRKRKFGSVLALMICSPSFRSNRLTSPSGSITYTSLGIRSCPGSV